MVQRRNPGGYGAHVGEDDYVNRAESRFVRQAIQPQDDGWLVSTVGDVAYGHMDVTGVLPGDDNLSLWYIPDRARNTWVNEARIRVCAAVASTTAEAAIYSYEDRQFKKVPFTHAFFDTATTGLKTCTLKEPAFLSKDAHLFIGIVCRDAAVALEGLQAGTASAGRVLRARTLTEPSSPQGTYPLDAFTASATQDAPYVAYLSKEAALVL